MNINEAGAYQSASSKYRVRESFFYFMICIREVDGGLNEPGVERERYHRDKHLRPQRRLLYCACVLLACVCVLSLIHI